jgi:hypothetical protein
MRLCHSRMRHTATLCMLLWRCATVGLGAATASPGPPVHVSPRAPGPARDVACTCGVRAVVARHLLCVRYTTAGPPPALPSARQAAPRGPPPDGPPCPPLWGGGCPAGGAARRAAPPPAAGGARGTHTRAQTQLLGLCLWPDLAVAGPGARTRDTDALHTHPHTHADGRHARGPLPGPMLAAQPRGRSPPQASAPLGPTLSDPTSRPRYT